ncbi:MAG: sensor histidine kinase [Solirubrobacteraceae bacterium]|nr:MAG: two-component sensor histidine kinase [Solirubrobacterales bacterium]
MKRRLVPAIAGVAASAVVLFALPLGVVLQRSYRDEELLRLQRDTVAATRGIDLTATGGDPVELPPARDQLAIYNSAGVLIAGRGSKRADDAARVALRTRRPTGVVAGGRLEVAVPLLTGERVTGVVRAERGQAGVDRRTHRAWLALAGLAAGVVALGVIAALALGRRLSRPLESLAGAARRVGEGDFAARAAPTGLSEIDDVGAALNSSSRRIDELVNRERAFSADASHQLRTPLAALRLELEGLALEPEPPAGLSAALTQVDRLQGTIETLLAVARGTPSGQQRTDLATVVRELETRWHGALAAEGRPLRVRVKVEPAVVAMSSAVLGEIAEVLMQNAHVHGAGAVSVTVRQLGDALALEVSDRGSGFGADHEGAFARGAGEGHGIGLALARSLAHAEGARLQITRVGPEPTVALLVPPAQNGASPSSMDSDGIDA